MDRDPWDRWGLVFLVVFEFHPLVLLDAGGVAKDQVQGFEDVVIRRSHVDEVEGHYHLALLGLQVLDLKLPSPVCFPFHSGPINQGSGGDIGCNGYREVHHQVLESLWLWRIAPVICLFGLGVAVILSFPVFLFFKNSIPGRKGILSKMREVDRYVTNCCYELGFVVASLCLRGARAKLGSRICPFVSSSLIAAMSSLGLSSFIKVMVASTKVRGWVYL